MKSAKFAFAIALAVALFLPVARAQNVFGRISGTVTDQSGGAVPSAELSAINEETKVTRATTTDTSGAYVFTNLAVGRYRISVTASGFKRSERSGIELVTDGRVSADLRLEIGDNTQSIQVVETAVEVVNVVSGELSRVVDSDQVQNLPLNGRNFMQLTQLIPGSVVTDADQMNLTTSISATTQNLNGNRGNAINQMVDGAYNLMSGSNASLISNVGVDFIREVKIQTSNFSAEYGRNSGAAVNVVTKGGTNLFHGSAFEFLRNDALDARNFFSPSRPKLRYNDFGWSFGGPVIKNRLFFFGGQEWKKIRRDTQPVQRSLPATRQLDGDFSGVATLRYPGTADPIPGNVIPASMVTPDGKALGNVYRAMRSAATASVDQPVANNATYQMGNPFNFREDIVRIDYSRNERHSFWGRFIADTYRVFDPFGTFINSALPTIPTDRVRPGRTIAVGWTWLIKPNLILESRANVNWNAQRIVPFGDAWKRSSYGFSFPELWPGGIYLGGIPNVTVSGYSGFLGPVGAQQSPTTDIQFSPNLSWITGKHIVKTGFTTFRDRFDVNGRPAYLGAVDFNTSGNTKTTGNSVADMLLGNFRTYSEASGDPIGFFRFSQYEAYIQDSYRASRRLSLEFGVRYQYEQPIYTQADNMVNFDPRLYDPAKALTLLLNGTIVPGSGNRYNGLILAGNGIPVNELPRLPNANSPDIPLVPTGAPRGLYNGQHRFAPRVSLAFAVNTKTALRGGFGIFYDRPEGNIILNEMNTPPYLSNATLENGNISNPAGGAASALSPFAALTTIDPKLDTPYSEQFSVGIQRQLPWDAFVEVSYVGNLGRHMLRRPDINQAPFEALRDNAALPTAQRWSTNALRPYKGYSNINQFMSDSTSNYHSLQVFGSRRKGYMSGTVSYTWSKVLGDASSNSENPEGYQNRHYNYGPLSYDRRHAFVLTSALETPKLKKWNGVLRTALANYELRAIMRLQTGAHLTVSGNTSIGGRRADYVGGDVQLPGDERTVQAWLNRSAFAAAPNERYGNSGFGVVTGPGKQIIDISARKAFRLSDRFTLRIQADFFNTFNITNFGNPTVNVSDIAYGRISSADPGRNIQLGTRLTF